MNEEPEETIFVRFKLLLEKQLAELQVLNEVGAEAARPVTLDQSRVGRLSRMDAMQGQQMAAETVRRRTEEIQRIRAALSRIERDEYGYCLRCEEDIDEKRLESNPSATLCIKCARG
ncbi:MAG: TraR/DksA family transcriptional regulator [Deltaproteobacteria bacterium]|nr:TraR/DksA family transcriptional regulator [Deltaproteobacteria bacterium]